MDQSVSGILDNATLAALECAVDQNYCTAICANPDLAGIGVRVAFYAQSVMNTLLVVLSPRDSVPSAWAGTLLTASLIIAAIVQKINKTLTLHHATLILNFATLSCISSLAAAPMLPIWRLRPHEYYAQELARHVLMDDGEDRNVLESEVYINRHKKKIKAAQNRERVVLSLALLTQVVLQWTWGILMFVSPSYSGAYCSKDTKLLFFLATFTGGQIDIRNGWIFAVWPMWLLFSLGITLVLTVVLALSSPNRAHDYAISRQTIGTATASTGSAQTPVIQGLINLTYGAFPAWGNRPKQIIFWGNVVCFCLWLLFLISAEWQTHKNRIFSGEQDFGGFGQVTALLLSLAPLWSLTVAVYKYPSLRKREERRRVHYAQRERSRERSHERHGSPTPSEADEVNGLLHGTGHRPTRRNRAPTPAPTHSPQGSTDSRATTAVNVGEFYEMNELALPGPERGRRGRPDRSRNLSEVSQFSVAATLASTSSGASGRSRRTPRGPRRPSVHVVTIPSPEMGLESFMDEQYFPGAGQR
ncbi:hypothetical protein BXZ70DRAFT_959185 [Cristinia sonorae]|uniref:Uncharacterized protein n=1 Tax=Cristinia sonorae TaxID=1940300 RepID=A0A8K0XKJ4_9AGAR|nr:hypothetical protein BXZ70DRAFT_959185 [Cristinia sonorae]